MEEDDILYQSIIADPEQVSPDVDVSGLRTQTETSPQLLAAVSEYPGLKFDPTQYSSYADLYDLYSKGVHMIDTSTVTTSGQFKQVGISTDPDNSDTGSANCNVYVVPNTGEHSWLLTTALA